MSRLPHAFGSFTGLAASLVFLSLICGCNDPLVSTMPGAPVGSSTPAAKPVVPTEPVLTQRDPAKTEVSIPVTAAKLVTKPETVAPPSAPAAVTTPAVAVATPIVEEPHKVEILIKEKTFKPEGPAKNLRVSFDDLDLLKVINMKPVTKDCIEKMPQWLKDLNGKQVVVRGFMKPAFMSEGIEGFVFVRDSSQCCFGPNPTVHDMIYVRLKLDETTDYIELRPFDVSGTFRIELLESDDSIAGLYFLDNAQVLTR